MFVAIFHSFIANEKPILIKKNGTYLSPIFSKKIKVESTDKVILYPLIRYSATTIDNNNTGFKSPIGRQMLVEGQQRHFLGTDLYGRDVMAGLIFGSYNALRIAVTSLIVALIIALILGLFPSFFGDKGFKIKILSVIFVVILTFILIYYLSYYQYFNSLLIYFILVILIILLIYFLMSKLKILQSTISIPLDIICNIIISIFQSLPGTFILIILVGMFSKATLWNIVFIIGILLSPVIARYIRAEVLKIKNERFIESSKIVGISDLKIIFRHVLPYTLTPVIVALSFGFSSAIMLESTLSFLGIGIPADHVSWGTLLSDARQNFGAWWMAVFPGLAIFLVILMFNSLGSMYRNKL